jgi:hypothetical protein
LFSGVDSHCCCLSYTFLGSSSRLDLSLVAGRQA